ncbi:unnamed protein product, partial [Prorocentrum cordatum]
MAEPECIQRHHFAKVCERRIRQGDVRKYWCGYVEIPSAGARGGFDKVVDAGAPHAPFFMVNKSFGIHESWARRWAYRLYKHRPSFSRRSHYRTRLGARSRCRTFGERARALEPDLAAERLERELDLLRNAADWYLPRMAERRLRAWRSSGDRLDVCAMDGNAKLYRRTCGTPCAEAVHCKVLDTHLVRGCSETPLRGGLVLCRRHQELTARADFREDIEAHRVKAPLSVGAFLEVEVRLAGNAGWQPAASVADEAVQAYFARIAEPVVQERKRLRMERRGQDRRAPRFVLGDWASREPKAKCACKTHKESISAVKTASRSAGFLTAVTQTGIVCGLQEVITAETLSQRYCFLAEMAHAVPELSILVHDDACHVRVFARCRAAEASPDSLPARLGEFRHIVDRPHSRGHVDPTCQELCFPDVPANAAALGSFPTPICESVNS